MLPTCLNADGYVVTTRLVAGQLAIWGVGDTPEAAWLDYETWITDPRSRPKGAAADLDAEQPLSYYYSHAILFPATQALRKLVEAKGGGCRWRSVGGVLCTFAEAVKALSVANDPGRGLCLVR